MNPYQRPRQTDYCAGKSTKILLQPAIVFKSDSFFRLIHLKNVSEQLNYVFLHYGFLHNAILHNQNK